MDPKTLRELLEAVQKGRVSPDQAMDQLRTLPFGGNLDRRIGITGRYSRLRAEEWDCLLQINAGLRQARFECCDGRGFVVPEKILHNRPQRSGPVQR